MVQTLSCDSSAVFRICLFIGSNFGLIPIAYSQQHLFGEIQISTLFAVVFQDVGFDNRVNGTAFFTKTAKNTFRQINVIA
jgi:hypothetical protein